MVCHEVSTTTGLMVLSFWTRQTSIKSTIRQPRGPCSTTQNGARIVIRLRHTSKTLHWTSKTGRPGCALPQLTVPASVLSKVKTMGKTFASSSLTLSLQCQIYHSGYKKVQVLNHCTFHSFAMKLWKFHDHCNECHEITKENFGPLSFYIFKLHKLSIFLSHHSSFCFISVS